MITRLLFLSQTPELQSYPLAKLRMIGLSATLSNINEIAEWFGVQRDGLFVFGEAYRPVTLIKKVLGYQSNGNYFLFEQSLNYKLKEIL